MSCNLGSTECERCGGTVALVETPRPTRDGDMSGYMLEQLPDLVVAHAECTVCRARYTAWCGGRAWGCEVNRDGLRDGRPFSDLSFRSTFNDEPRPEDLPAFKPVEVGGLRLEMTGAHWRSMTMAIHLPDGRVAEGITAGAAFEAAVAIALKAEGLADTPACAAGEE